MHIFKTVIVMVKCPACGAEIREVKSHVGLILNEKYIFEDILLESGEKYVRGIRYGFLPPRRDPLGTCYEACILTGSLEISKSDGKAFYNPFKFYLTPTNLQKIHKHTINTLVLEALARTYINMLKRIDLEPRPVFELFKLIDEIHHTPSEQRILEEVIKKFWNKMMGI